MGRCHHRLASSSALPLAAVALLVLVCVVSQCGGAAAARLLLPAPPVHFENGVSNKDAAEGPVVLQQGAASAAGNGDELSISEMMGAEEDVEEAACEDGNDDECAQRRLLRDAHLDYIYTQHKGKP